MGHNKFEATKSALRISNDYHGKTCFQPLGYIADDASNIIRHIIFHIIEYFHAQIKIVKKTTSYYDNH